MKLEDIKVGHYYLVTKESMGTTCCVTLEIGATYNKGHIIIKITDIQTSAGTILHYKNKYDKNCWGCIHPEHIVKEVLDFNDTDLVLSDDIMTVKSGDIIVSNIGTYRRIHATIDDIIICSDTNLTAKDAKRDITCHAIGTFLQYKKDGWKKYVAETLPKSDIIELTIDDIAALKGVDASKIKIKK
jgi:hypothetical protein